MEETLPRPSYLYIPEPIERQLPTKELGTLLEVYKWGWIEHDNRRSMIRRIIFNVVLLAILVISMLTIFDVLVTTHVLLLKLFIFPFIAVIGLIVTLPTMFQPSLCVGAFDNGLIYAKNKQVMVLPWNTIQRFENTTIQSKLGAGTLREFTISSFDGVTIRFKAPAIQLQDLGKIIQAHIPA